MNFNAAQVEVKLLRENSKLPEYQTNGAAAADAYAAIDEPIVVQPGESKVIPLGFSVAVPDGMFLAVLSRSGLAAKNNIQVGNCPGVVDSDYRGEVGAILYNGSNQQLRDECCKCDRDFCEGCVLEDNQYIITTGKPFTVNPGDRVCQVALVPVYRINWKLVDALDKTERGAGGFGSTGK